MLHPKTCLVTVSVHGTCKVFGGTGKFAKIPEHEPAKRASWPFSPDPESARDDQVATGLLADHHCVRPVTF